MLRHFYALPEDLLVVFAAIEKDRQLRYTPMGVFEDSTVPSVQNGALLPTLRDPPPSTSAISGHRYLVTRHEVVPSARRISLSTCGTRYAIDQLNNPDSMELLPGSWHSSRAILYGRVGTCSESATSRQLFSYFKRAIGKHFRKINAFWVGPQAETAWKQGARLTGGLSSPPENDLREPSADAV